jgi:hypothetical protein
MGLFLESERSVYSTPLTLKRLMPQYFSDSIGLSLIPWLLIAHFARLVAHVCLFSVGPIPHFLGRLLFTPTRSWDGVGKVSFKEWTC